MKASEVGKPEAQGMKRAVLLERGAMAEGFLTGEDQRLPVVRMYVEIQTRG